MSRIVSEVDFFVPRRNAVVTARDLALSESGLLHLLDAHTRIAADYLRAYPQTPRLYESGVRYRREKKKRGGPEVWRDIPHTLRKRIGDCEELGTWLAGERQAYDGIDAWPELRGVIARIDGKERFLYHVLVRHPDGQIEDPSRVLGMHPRKVA